VGTKRKTLTIADLFCGAGGTSSGAVAAAEALGYEVKLTAINHWDVAIATHQANHPEARHLCTSIDDLNPRNLFAEGELDILWASPECTHHSIARGGRPINDQSRATAWCVTRWAEALRPSVIMVENVPEFLSWGGLGHNGRPLASKKGATFAAWVEVLRSLGYRVEWKVLCAADYGDPTTRKRLFVQAVRGRRRIVWPEATHAPGAAEADLFGKRKPWVAAREIIDWELPAPSIYKRKRPLSGKTMQRILEGLKKFGLQPCVVGAGGPEYASKARSVDEPLNTVMCESRAAVARPFIVAWDHQSGPGVWSQDEPLTTVTTKARHGVAQPFIIPNFGERDGQKPLVHAVDDPLPTVTSHGAGGLVQPFLVELRGTSEKQLANKAQDVNEPLGTVTAGGVHHGLVEPYLVTVANGGEDKYRARSIDDPLPTVTAGGSRVGLAQPFLVATAHDGDGRVRSVDVPLPTVCGNRGDMALVEPSLLPQQSDGRLRPVSEPVPTVATSGAVALVKPVLVPFYGTSKGASVDEPLDTVTCTDRFGLALPRVEIDGEVYLLDIGFRMLQPHELSAAQGFPKGYKFTGTKTQQVKQIGNAVPHHLAKALVSAALQN
jgi:DNA (cytosine-5)-methyltransferase 1